jgi:GNAT superfamily N-acetyltransferase
MNQQEACLGVNNRATRRPRGPRTLLNRFNRAIVMRKKSEPTIFAFLYHPLRDLLNEPHDRDMRGPHWYLPIIGVEPSRQGTGIGSALLRPGLARADEWGLACYLDTGQPRNVRFYNARGSKSPSKAWSLSASYPIGHSGETRQEHKGTAQTARPRFNRFTLGVLIFAVTHCGSGVDSNPRCR